VPKPVAHVEGTKEAQDAFKEFGRELDYGAMAQAAGDVMLPDIERMSRVKSGAMQISWETVAFEKEAYFDNSQDYWTFQEFGTESVEPSMVIVRSWEKNEKDVVKAYDGLVKETAKDAGFSQSR
jgi:hypothetical protein